MTAHSNHGGRNFQNTGAWLPEHNNFLTATCDPSLIGGGSAPAAGVVYVSKVWLPKPITITNIHCWIQVAASAESANCFMAAFDSAGTRLGNSADQAVAFRSTRLKTAALSLDGGQTLTRAGNTFVYGAILMGTQGATPAQVGRIVAGAASAGLPNANLTVGEGWRYGSTGSGLSAMPTSFTVSGLGEAAAGLQFWIAFS